MSHFTVLVVGENPEEQLEPFHEFECTGVDNKYIQDVDLTEKALEEYNSDTTNKLKDKEGTFHSPYDNKFYREVTDKEKKDNPHMSGTGCGNGLSWSSQDWGDGKGYRPKIKFIPEGYEEVVVNTKDFESFISYVDGYYGYKPVFFGQEIDKEEDHKYGYVLLDKDNQVIKVVNRTNPDAKWDWFQVGGRWTGKFKMKEGKEGGIGTPGLSGREPKSGYADQALKSDIDFEGMKKETEDMARSRYKRVVNIFGGIIPKMDYIWVDLVNDDSIEDMEVKRKMYWNQPSLLTIDSIKKTKKDTLSKEDMELLTWLKLENYQVDEEEYVEREVLSSLPTFAIIKDGKWYEKGEMGWWGAVSNTKEENSWNKEFNNLLESLPEDTLLTIVDCHI